MTLVAFQQGLGRSVRHKNDWCKTYLLDASFDSFFTRYEMPKIIKSRLQDTSVDNLDIKLASADDEWEEMMKKLQS
jgi:Rad3-related DNA helicase